MRAILRALADHRRVIAIYGLLLLAGWFMAGVLRGIALPELRPMNEPLIHRMMMMALVAYVIMAALPFVPGAEIGFALLLLFGGAAAPLVYGGMVGALTLSFLVATMLPPAAAVAAFRRLGFQGFATLLEDLRNTPAEARAGWLAARAPGRIAKLAVRNRYLLLLALINTPGNSLIGGGGGIAFMAGLSGIFGPIRYLVTIAVAVAPLPLAFALLF